MVAMVLDFLDGFGTKRPEGSEATDICGIHPVAPLRQPQLVATSNGCRRIRARRAFDDLTGSREKGGPSNPRVEAKERIMKTYQLVIYRDGRWWMVSVPEIDGLTQARNLKEAEAMGRDLIAITLDVPIDSFDVEVSLASIGDVERISDQVTQIAARRRTAEQLEQEASEQAIQLAKKLSAQNVSMRDIGTILGISHQRANQLVHS
jgi:predicted RNase H-like HicB family nuclease